MHEILYSRKLDKYIFPITFSNMRLDLVIIIVASQIQWFSAKGGFPSQKTSGDVWRHFGCHNWREGAKGSNEQRLEILLTSCNVQYIPHNKKLDGPKCQLCPGQKCWTGQFQDCHRVSVCYNLNSTSFWNLSPCTHIRDSQSRDAHIYYILPWNVEKILWETWSVQVPRFSTAWLGFLTIIIEALPMVEPLQFQWSYPELLPDGY